MGDSQKRLMIHKNVFISDDGCNLYMAGGRLVAGGMWLVAGGMWLVAGGMWLVVGGWWLAVVTPGLALVWSDRVVRPYNTISIN